MLFWLRFFALVLLAAIVSEPTTRQPVARPCCIATTPLRHRAALVSRIGQRPPAELWVTMPPQQGNERSSERRVCRLQTRLFCRRPMAAKKYFEFNTDAECRAFVKGVLYVNDGTIRVEGTFDVPGAGNRRFIDTKRYVHILDLDGSRSDSDKMPPRWRNRSKIEQE
jgi:hypothetical protein